MSDDESLLWTAAKAVAEQRQHGCHYAEGACPACIALAEVALRAVITEEPAEGALVLMSRAALSHVDHMRFAYRAMPVWRVLWGYYYDPESGHYRELGE